MKAMTLQADGGAQRYALIFDKGDEMIQVLTAFAKEHGLSAAQFTAIGAFSRAVLGYFDRERKDYLKISVPSQVEVVSLLGDIALKGHEPVIHAHAVLGQPDGTARVGHLLEGHVWPTLELILEESPRDLRKRYDPETGLTLIDLPGRRWGASEGS
jgi:predicted DNA-binding protein with PD1-like motif